MGSQSKSTQRFYSTNFMKSVLCFFLLLFKAQVVLLIILLAAIADFLIGSIIGPKSDTEYARGFVGYNGK